MTVFLAFLAGLLIGSFLNVCIERWPAEKSVVAPRSHCPRCGAMIRWYDNVPLLSYALLKGCCRDCEARIPVRFPLVEVLNGLIYAGVTVKFGWGPLAWKTAVFSSMMVVLVFSDFEQYILPDEITLGGLAIGLAAKTDSASEACQGSGSLSAINQNSALTPRSNNTKGLAANPIAKPPSVISSGKM